MKTFIFITLLAQQSYAVVTLNQGNALKCVRQLLPTMQDFTFEVPERTTIMHMFKEGWGGGIYSDDIRSGVLLIERNQVRVCPMEWNLSGINYFRAEDSAGRMWYSYERGKATPFRESNSWVASYNKPYCRDVTNDTATITFLQKIVADQVLARNQDPKQVMPAQCGGLISQQDLAQALKRRELAQPQSSPSGRTAPGNAEGN